MRKQPISFTLRLSARTERTKLSENSRRITGHAGKDNAKSMTHFSQFVSRCQSSIIPAGGPVVEKVRPGAPSLSRVWMACRFVSAVLIRYLMLTLSAGLDIFVSFQRRLCVGTRG
ncbi:hypothetical protein E2C01_011981 [Portunus trituberculatus]|uniref:Uncharacterized protein n=1 Tax=Portunus trituberculatus TaxID=210409 RepID=A0A5B7DDE2_PORTR|nr:hypothetical protein [Portunus trituberculatus]